MYHNPVLLNECIKGLNIKPSGIYVDVTYGGGGHSKEILKHLNEGRLIAFDQDSDANENGIDDSRFLLINNNFRYLKNFLKLHSIDKIDGLLADLGISSHQIDIPERGFSTRFDSDLDMRMNQNQSLNAADIINTYEEYEIISILRNYGEVINPACFAKNIIKNRPIYKTSQLIEAVSNCFPNHKKNKILAQVFQALRIEVNNEIDSLKELLKQSVEVLNPQGRLVIISYHSLEDRIVKNFFKSGNFEGKIEKDFYGNPLVELKTITKKPITPELSELEQNSRSRSAKLRIAEKK